MSITDMSTILSKTELQMRIIIMILDDALGIVQLGTKCFADYGPKLDDCPSG